MGYRSLRQHPRCHPGLNAAGGLEVQALPISRSGTCGRVLSGSSDETVRIWERHSGNSVATLPTEGLYAGTSSSR